MQNPKILQLSALDYDYNDYEFKVSDIEYYYIIPAHELAEHNIKFKSNVNRHRHLTIITCRDNCRYLTLIAYVQKR